MDENDTRFNRLCWRRTGERRFAAYPNGDGRPDQIATVAFSKRPSTDSCLAPEWFWRASWAGRFEKSGSAHTKQDAADFATIAWWRGVAEAESRERIERPIRAFMDRLIETGEFDLGALDITGMVYGDLMRLMDEVTRRWHGGTIYPRTEFVDQFGQVAGELSAELHRRRTRG